MKKTENLKIFFSSINIQKMQSRIIFTQKNRLVPINIKKMDGRTDGKRTANRRKDGHIYKQTNKYFYNNSHINAF